MLSLLHHNLIRQHSHVDKGLSTCESVTHLQVKSSAVSPGRHEPPFRQGFMEHASDTGLGVLGAPVPVTPATRWTETLQVRRITEKTVMAIWRIAIATRQDEDQIEPVDLKVGALASVNQSTNCMFEVVLTLYNRVGIARNARVYQPRPLLKLDALSSLYTVQYTIHSELCHVVSHRTGSSWKVCGPAVCC